MSKPPIALVRWSVVTFVLALPVGCIIPAGPQTIPASGLPGQPRASMTSSLDKGANPFRDVYFALDPESNARRFANQWRSSRPADAAAMDKIASQPSAAWFGNWNPNVSAAVEIYVRAHTRAGGLPVFVLYNLPFRDCGLYSKGGAGSVAGYHKWIDAVASGIGSRRAVVVLEPDGLPQMTDCLDARRREERIAMVGYAIDKLSALDGTAVYVDAGHSAWVPAPEMASRLHAAGIDRAAGFALNVSNYQATPDLLAYGRQISALVGGKHFIVDTSRNGNGAPAGFQPKDERNWCNPDGRALGAPPTTNTGEPLCDAFYWIKPPGESDGTCNKGPSAGAFWPQKALEMATNARW
jgi:endoglucanase